MRRSRRALRWIGVAAGVLIAAAPTARGQEVLLTEKQALAELFPEAARAVADTRALPDSARRRLERKLGRPVAADSVNVTRLLDASGGLLGYAVVTEEIGKYRPITFMVGVTPDLKVRDVAVMIYRESRGGDVKRRRFLSQYRGKTAADPIELGRDIVNVSGATISVRSLNAGVKRVLAELAMLYGPGPAK